MKKIILIPTVISVVLISFAAYASQTFEDVNSAHNYSEAIDFIASENIVSGYDDGTFRPYNTLSRSELLKIVIEAVYEDEFYLFGSTSCFTDVPANEWFTPYVCFAKDKGIVQGYGDGSFKPGSEISFAEALKITLKTFNEDTELLDPWYKGYVELAGSKNLIPLSVSSFNQNFSRGQMAELIARILHYNEGDLDSYLGDKASSQVTYEKLEYIETNTVELNGADTCFYNDNTCSANEFCIKDTCVEKSKVIPSNEESSLTNCAYNEVYVDGQCEKAKLTVTFLGFNPERSEEMDEYVDYSMAGFISLVGMSACPDKVRIIRDYDFCIPESEELLQVSDVLGDELENRFGGVSHFFILGLGEENNCYDSSGEKYEHEYGYVSVGQNSTLVHELGHVAGLWDQYCYFPSPENPNIVDFESANCKVAEGEFNEWYCGREDLGASPDNPYECEGNLNSSEGRSIMGLGNYDLGTSLIGYSETELEYLAESLNCY